MARPAVPADLVDPARGGPFFGLRDVSCAIRQLRGAAGRADCAARARCAQGLLRSDSPAECPRLGRWRGSGPGLVPRLVSVTLRGQVHARLLVAYLNEVQVVPLLGRCHRSFEECQAPIRHLFGSGGKAEGGRPRRALPRGELSASPAVRERLSRGQASRTERIARSEILQGRGVFRRWILAWFGR